jgi:predicted N-formylglutamate amidohydrolase
VLISCEHGGNRIPAEYKPLFAGHARALDSHRGYDMGALQLARELAAHFGAPLFYSTTSRLLVDLNRSRSHPNLFSAAVRGAPADVRARLLQRYYDPYRSDVENRVNAAAGAGYRAVHVSCHSFTPVMDNVTRRADIGLLFDPSRSAEAQLCAAWQGELQRLRPELVVRRNYPYRGVSDGLVSHLRRHFGEVNYIGIELEVNQRQAAATASRWRALRADLISSFAAALAAQA